MRDYTCAQVADWLNAIGLEQYQESFVKNNICGRHLPMLNRKYLKYLGVDVLHNRLKLLREIEHLEWSTKLHVLRFIACNGQTRAVQTTANLYEALCRALRKFGLQDPEKWGVCVTQSSRLVHLTQEDFDELCRDPRRPERERLILIDKNSTAPSFEDLRRSWEIEAAQNVGSLPSGKGGGGGNSRSGSMKTNSKLPFYNLASLGCSFSDLKFERSGAGFGSGGVKPFPRNERPPSELISSRISDFFPDHQPQLLEKTLSNSFRKSVRSINQSIFEFGKEIKPKPQRHRRMSSVKRPPLPTVPDFPSPVEVKEAVSSSSTLSAPIPASSSPSDRNSSSADVPVVSPDPQSLKFLEYGSPMPSPTLTAGSDDTVGNEEDNDESTIKWIRGALIGAGSFGEVYLGMNAFNGELMAVKQVRLNNSDSRAQNRQRVMLEALKSEIVLLKNLSHKHIVQYLGSNVTGDCLNIFLEYVPGGSVHSLLETYGNFEEPLVRNLVPQILSGLEYLHSRDIIHRDIKGANILIDNKGQIKISDFGISKKIEDNIQQTVNNRFSFQGSAFWMAPEVVQQTKYTKKTDIWSLGCLTVEMLTGKHPYPKCNQTQAIFRIGKLIAPDIPSTISAEAKDFLAQTFIVEYERRPNASELLKHPFVCKSSHSSSSSLSSAS
ncbi:STE/STE11 protein kinase Byr2 [Schizosaccharomyces japonicus yFS275]|uniref:mitogen-activated protein kinase kinase kinase n=1 Tax=Schizosaccharomyces japonicus (strain yFS275 / FY16936) TaxID=402676 RepID=B6JYQ3_SCHJY|nr:STE/STE11 protein kinase Byr2 [Schizosaccharomyces japonicus yFS275]EEB06671.1 STE/STE11 protein kinase Byr2 [Schizosaccharomyces japonicus yFS275]